MMQLRHRAAGSMHGKAAWSDRPGIWSPYVHGGCLAWTHGLTVKGLEGCSPPDRVLEPPRSCNLFFGDVAAVPFAPMQTAMGMLAVPHPKHCKLVDEGYQKKCSQE